MGQIRIGRIAGVLCGLLAATAIWGAAGASAAIPATLSESENCTTHTDAPLDYAFCDDGVPPTGGTTPNLGGTAAITVPARYGGDGYTGLPLKAAGAGAEPGADPTGDVALDVDVSLPLSAPPAGGYPLVVFMHGCCAGNKTSWEARDFTSTGERWHYSNAWFASRGYAVLNYTSRGFVSGQASGNRGSTGETQLDSREYEINDFQSLACQTLAQASSFDSITGQSVAIDPSKVVVTGGSYGGGFAWMALTDPKWTCNADSGAAGMAMKLAASAPRYGWTDLVESLVPTGHHSSDPGDLPDFDGCDSGPRKYDASPCPEPRTPVGTPKSSILAGLYASGKTGIPPGTGSHATFPPAVDQAFTCLNGTYPPPSPGICDTTINQTLPAFLRERSAYYQQDWFETIKTDPSYRIPIFSAATNTDPLFPPVEHRRMINRILSEVSDYPVQSYHGDYQHFVQNKAKEWADLCGVDRHRCNAADYPNAGADPADYNAAPTNRENRGVTSRLNRFVDHYTAPAANPSEPAPVQDVTASLQACPANAAELGVAPDEPGPTFTAPTFEQLAPNTLVVAVAGSQTTSNMVAGNPHAANADPIGNSLRNGGSCPVESGPAGPGVAVYTSDALSSAYTMIGATHAAVDFTATAPPGDNGFQLNSRLYDVFPDGSAVMVDRGVRRVASTGGTETLELRGNGWRFEPGHRIRIEIAQDDSPNVKASTVPSSATLTAVELKIPVRETGASVSGSAGQPGDNSSSSTPPGAKPQKGRCANVQVGSSGRDFLRGTGAGDRLAGKGGKDRLIGRGGKDCLIGGGGADRANGGGGADVVKGSAGKDRLNGGRGADKVSGGAGKDRLTGKGGSDRLAGGAGDDRIIARGGGRDTVNCGRGTDVVVVDGRDKLRGCERIKRKRPKRR